jgi:hypothetical protein
LRKVLRVNSRKHSSPGVSRHPAIQPGLRTGVVLLLALIVAQLLVIAMRGILRAGIGAVSANRVLGQVDFIKNAPNFVDAIGMNAPADVAIDQADGHVIVADSQNNRVLGWKSASAFTSGGAADLVIGQPDFNSSGCNQNNSTPDATTLCRPIGVAFDGAHRVYVGDAQNNRVLVYDDPFAVLSATNQSIFRRCGLWAGGELCRECGERGRPEPRQSL